MSKVIITESNLTNIAEAIRNKTGSSATYTPGQMPEAINNIPVSKFEETFEVTPTTSEQTVTPREGYVFSGGTVHAMPTGIMGTVSASKGSVTDHSVSVTPAISAGTPGYNAMAAATGSAVTVSASELVSGNKSLAPSTSAQTGIDVTNYATVSVSAMPSGTEGTPVATKGAVANHAVSITPSVTNTAGYVAGGTHTGSAVTVNASELVSGNLALNSSASAQTGVDVTNYATVSVAAMPVNPLDNTIIAGEAEEEATGDYAWKSTVSIPTGYHTAQTLTKTFSEIFPAPETPATASEMRLGYQAYNKSGQLMTGTMANQTPAFDGGAMSEGGIIGSVSTIPVVTPVVSGTVGDIVVDERPSGTDGTDYWTIDPAGTVTTTGKVTGSKTITRAAVQYNGAVNGYVNQPDNTVVIAADTAGKTVSVDTSVTPRISAGANFYIKKAVNGTVSADKNISEHTATITPSVSAGTAGYSDMAAQSGTAVTVSANELVSGNINLTNTNSTDVTNYATAQIVDANLIAANIITGKTILGINGNHEDIPNIPTDAGMTEFNVDENIGRICKFVGTTGTYVNDSFYLVKETPSITPLCITATEANSTVTLTKIGNPSWTGSYSLDGITWNTYVPETQVSESNYSNTITLANIGDKVYFKGVYTAANEYDKHLQFVMSGELSTSGSIMSMCSGDNYSTATTIPYDYMFTALFYLCPIISAPLLPATTLTACCYYNMFNGCATLSAAPELPATTLAMSCYANMFENCLSLYKLPELSATTLADYCYWQMFYNSGAMLCTGNAGSYSIPWRLPSAGTIDTIPEGALSDMFGCTNILFDTFTANTTYYSYNDEYTPDLPLHFAAVEANSTIKLQYVGYSSVSKVPWSGSYSLDNNTWINYDLSTQPVITLANIGDKVYFKGTYTGANSGSKYLQFVMTGKVVAEGCIMSFCSGDNYISTTIPYGYMFNSLFKDCTALLTTPFLGFTNLTVQCCADMFNGCSELRDVTPLYAEVGTYCCYAHMFENCTSLVKSYDIYLTSMDTSSCYKMYNGCAKLLLPLTILYTPTVPYGGYQEMYGNCTSLLYPPIIQATSIGQYGCYAMFYNCSALIRVPVLHATTLTTSCYERMFLSCSRLYVEDTSPAFYYSPWTIPADGVANAAGAMSYMFTGCKGTRSTDGPTFDNTQITYYVVNTPVGG